MYWTPSPPASLNRGDGSHALVGGNGQDDWISQPGPLSWVSLEPGFGEAERSAAGICSRAGGRRSPARPHLCCPGGSVWLSDTPVFSGTFRGPPRRPPPHILDQVKSLNQSLRLGHLLCRSRNPDFLLNIIQRQASLRTGRRASRASQLWR